MGFNSGLKWLNRTANVECQQYDQTTEHISSTCPILAKELVQRHAELHSENSGKIRRVTMVFIIYQNQYKKDTRAG
jgi:hypothetical protein